MDETALFELLSTLKYPVAYDHFFSADKHPPFILYRNANAPSFYADDSTYHLGKDYIVDLITETKNTDLEKTLEKLFTDNHLPFDKEEDYISTEYIYQIRYFI